VRAITVAQRYIYIYIHIYTHLYLQDKIRRSSSNLHQSDVASLMLRVAVWFVCASACGMCINRGVPWPHQAVHHAQYPCHRIPAPSLFFILLIGSRMTSHPPSFWQTKLLQQRLSRLFPRRRHEMFVHARQVKVDIILGRVRVGRAVHAFAQLVLNAVAAGSVGAARGPACCRLR